MVIKMDSPPRLSPEAASDREDQADDLVTSLDASTTASDPLRGVKPGSGSSITKKSKSTEVEFSRLKTLVPSISKKSSVSKLDVILEAIRYIDQLQDQLVEQIAEQRLHPSLAADFLVGKENTNSDLLDRLNKNNKEN